MISKRKCIAARFSMCVLVGTYLVLPAGRSSAQEAAENGSGEASPVSGELQREYARLAQLLNSTDTIGRREAADTLLRVRPSDVANPDTRKLIARGYRAVALEDRISQEEGIRGLVIWGGKYSVPILIEIMEKERLKLPDALFDGLGQLKDPKGAEAMARQLGNFFNHDGAVRSLRRMGSVAEDSLIKAAPSNDAKASLAAVQLLGDVGSQKSLDILQKASQARNPEIKAAARDAIKRIRDRQKSGESVDKPEPEDRDSPFNSSTGPAIDITARNSNRPPRMPGMPAGFGGPGAADEPQDISVEQGDWSKVRPLLPGEPLAEGISPDPAANQSDPQWRPQPVRLGNATNATERPSSLALNRDSPVGLVLYSDPFHKSLGRLDVFDVKQRKTVSTSNVLGGSEVCAISSSGTHVLTMGQDDSHERKIRCTLYNLAGGKLDERSTWWPYYSADVWQNMVRGAGWISEDRFYTINGKGMLVVWEVGDKSPSAIYQLDGEVTSQAALSPGRAQFALSTPRGVEIFRAADGELLARMKESPNVRGLPAFSAKGDRLAIVFGKQIMIWNAVSGELQRNFDCMNLTSSNSLEWLDDTHLLVGHTDLVDIERRLLLWRYELSNSLACFQYDRLWLLMTVGNSQGLVPVQLMQPKVLEAAAKLDADEILALKPGARISLEVSLGGDDYTKAMRSLQDALAKNGFTVADNQPLRLRAQIVTGDSTTKEYGRHAFDSQRESVTVTQQRYEVELLVDGQSAWKSTSVLQGYAPSVVLTKEGETAQQAIDRENQQRLAGYSFGVTLPQYVVHPKYAGPLGTSKVTSSGVE